MVEWVKEPRRKWVKVRIPAHWVEFLKEEAQRMNEATGTEDHDMGTVIYYAIKKLARERGFVQVGSNRSGVVVNHGESEVG